MWNLLKILRMVSATRHRPTIRQPTPIVSSDSGRILFISGEAGTPGHIYRVERYAASATEAGFRVAIVRVEDLQPDVTRGLQRAFVQLGGLPPHLTVIWRAAWSGELRSAVRQLKNAGGRIAFDVDDYMFDPALAKRDIIDGIRSQSVTEEAVAELYTRVNHTLMKCEAGIAPTEPLASAMRRWGKPAYVLHNGFDAETYATSRRAVMARRREPSDGLIRIGYAAGSRTHQRDFGLAAPALGRILEECAACRLVLFHAGPDLPLVDLQEFPELANVYDRIEWRPLRTLRELPIELARFDINVAPLETGNVFCEAKSELKFFEAALVDTCTVASPTPPFASAIRHGVTGMLAEGPEAWYTALRSLVDDPARRRTMAQAALHDVLWRYGPDGRRQAAASAYRRLIGEPSERVREFTCFRSCKDQSMSLPHVPDTEELYRHESGDLPDISVVVPCYNYARFVGEALESVADQSEARLELIVVDDCSTDDSVTVVGTWMRRHAGRFIRAIHLRNHVNSGLSLTRNAGFAASEAGLVFPLDADNTLTPTCLQMLREALMASDAAAAHPTLLRFGEETKRLPAWPWDPDRFRNGNFIDAMALIRKSAWCRVGGYEPMPLGWEDYDFWCLFIEAGLWSLAVPDACARYRVHGTSMLHSVTDVRRNRVALKEALHRRHPWLDIPLPAAA